MAFLWLGCTVLLNAERRTLGTWLASSALLLSGAFFAAHSMVAAGDLWGELHQLAFWWPMSWLPFIALPFLWYLVVSWYAGRLHEPWHRRQAVGLGVIGLAAAIVLTIVSPFPLPLPSAANVALTVAHERAPGSLRALLIYPAFSLACIVLALRILMRPAPSGRFMGEIARRRALPWLVATSLALLIVSAAVGALSAWLVTQVTPDRPITTETLWPIKGFDILLSSLLAVTVILLGRAIVTYEVFTGKVLPRGGLRRHWRNSLILAATIGLLVGGTLGVPIDPVPRLLLVTVMITVLYALHGWRTYAEREQGLARLRLFVGSEHLYERLVGSSSVGSGIDAERQFDALCGEVLGARVAYLVAIGPAAPLVRPLAYPRDAATFAPPLDGLMALLSTDALCVPLAPENSGAAWAVPLWNERGQIGALLLGERADERLYTQEEIEIARAACERIIDRQVTAEMSRRLMDLQRAQLSGTPVLDSHARQLLHDETLPRLHTAMLLLARRSGEAADNASDAAALIAQTHGEISALLRATGGPAAPRVAELGLTRALREALEAELGGAFDSVSWRLDAEAVDAVDQLSATNAEVAFCAAREVIRNAAAHGRNGDMKRPLHLAIELNRKHGLQLAIEDDGVGLEATATDARGSGQGLALHSTLMAVIGGGLTVESAANRFTRVTLILPG
ncbi:MAG: Histidine kinase protein [Chloroflexi bacterium]|nr:Histidine kinase protein [Chloroflexota bacterium]